MANSQEFRQKTKKLMIAMKDGESEGDGHEDGEVGHAQRSARD